MKFGLEDLDSVARRSMLRLHTVVRLGRVGTAVAVDYLVQSIGHRFGRTKVAVEGENPPGPSEVPGTAPAV